MNLYDRILSLLQSDKWQHFLTGCFLALPVAVFFGPLYAIGFAFLIGFTKELLDYLDNKYHGTQHGVELWDALATGLGGVYVGELVDLAGRL